MAKIKNIVKVMNFHSLVRVEKARRTAEKYFDIEKELTKMIYQIVYNKNLTLDKKILLTNKSGVVLNIYIGNDLGFCGNFNSQLQEEIKKDVDSIKIIIGKKIFPRDNSTVKMMITKENFFQDYSKIESLIYDYVENQNLKELSVIYNHYYNVNDIRFEKKQLFPLQLEEPDKKELNLNVDYVIETDINKAITSMLALYICYQIKILESNSWASENVMRESITRQSIDKIEAIEEEENSKNRKEKKYKEFKSQINNYKNIKE